jgi:transposase
MRGAYPCELRVRAIALVEAGASRREAAEQLEIGVSSAIRWVRQWFDDRIAAPKPRGGSISQLEEHAERILALVAEQPDLTLDEIVLAMHERQIPGSRTALVRFFTRHRITVKKKACGPQSNNVPTWRAPAGGGFAIKVCLIQPDLCSSMRPR